MTYQLPIEGAVYRDPVAGEFRILATGQRHGHRAFVMKLKDHISVFKMSAWETIFSNPSLLRKAAVSSSDKRCGFYYGEKCQVTKTANDEIVIVNSSGESDWTIKYPDPQIR